MDNIKLSLNNYANYVMDWRISKGFDTPENISNTKNANDMLGKLMLVVTEIAEASEAVRMFDRDNFIEELADTFIRLLDIVATNRIDIEDAIRTKMDFNFNRPVFHGKRTTL